MNKPLYPIRISFRIDDRINNELRVRIDREKVPMGKYIRDIVKKALISEHNIDTTAHIVGFNQSDNVKVTTLKTPVSFKKINLKMGDKNV